MVSRSSVVNSVVFLISRLTSCFPMYFKTSSRDLWCGALTNPFRCKCVSFFKFDREIKFGHDTCTLSLTRSGQIFDKSSRPNPLLPKISEYEFSKCFSFSLLYGSLWYTSARTTNRDWALPRYSSLGKAMRASANPSVVIDEGLTKINFFRLLHPATRSLRPLSFRRYHRSISRCSNSGQ